MQAGKGEWRLLAEWSVTSVPGNERQALERVAEVVGPLHLSPDRLDNLKTAVAEAVMNAMEHGNHYQPGTVVTLQALATETAISVRVRDQGEAMAIPETTSPDLEAKLAGLESPRGWGLFLIKNLVDELHVTREEPHNVVELIMYRQEKNAGDSQV